MRFVGVEDVPIDSLEDYPGNARVHDEDALDESARTNGQYRSVVARVLPGGRRQLLAGHGTREAFRRQGAESLRVEVLEADDDEALRINLADNGSARNAGYDDTLLAELLAQAAAADGGLAGTGWDEAAYRELVERLEPPPSDVVYTGAVNIPQYEVVGPCPAVADLWDETKAGELRARIADADVPAEIRDYLLAAAARHTVFNYRRAAEFYPHASAEVQALMEDSALVIIDVDDAIARGYARLTETLTGIRELDAADAAEGGDDDD